MESIDTNYYLLLDLPLDPPVTDRTRLEAVIQNKQTEWKKSILNPSKGLLFMSLVERVPEIKRALLLDDAARDVVIADAVRIAKDRALSLVGAIAKAGSVSEAQIEAICKRVPQFSERSIRQMIRVPIKESSELSFAIPKKPSDPLVKPMDAMLMDMIERNLQVIKKKDIYDFLGCTRDSSPEAMSRIADGILSKLYKSPRKSAEVYASEELAGFVKTHFLKPTAKEAYEIALKTYLPRKRLVEIFSLRCISKHIDWASYRLSIDECMEIGMSREEAEYYVYEYYCLRRKCPLPISVDQRPEQANKNIGD